MDGHERISGIARLDRGTNRGAAGGDIRLVVSSPPADRRKERAFAYLPWPVRLALKLGVPVLVLAAIVVLPNYLGCRGLHESGMFYYGTTVAACTNQDISGQIVGTHRLFEGIARAVGLR